MVRTTHSCDSPRMGSSLARACPCALPQTPFADQIEFTAFPSTGKIKALWFIATNPAVSFPNYSVLEQALRSVEFLVVQDGFHPTPTSDFADLVLPAAIWGEKEGTYTNSERRVNKVNAFVSPPGDARSDFDIFLSIAERLGVKQELYPGWTSTHDAFLEWQRVSAGRMCDYSEFTWQQIEDNGGMQWGGS